MTKNERLKLYAVKEIIIEAFKEGIEVSNEQLDELWSNLRVVKPKENDDEQVS